MSLMRDGRNLNMKSKVPKYGFKQLFLFFLPYATEVAFGKPESSFLSATVD
jgi:hypothetical protein